MIRVLIVDDSASMRLFIEQLVGAAGDMEVVGVAVNGAEAVTLTCSLRPDIVVMDIHMPIMDGYAATKEIMQCCPTPIVVASALVKGDSGREVFLALEAGAVAAVEKPRRGSAQHADSCDAFVATLRETATVKVKKQACSPALMPAPDLPAAIIPYSLVAIGSSTGGPVALQQLLNQLPADFALPIVVVQHISPGFIAGMVAWLEKSCKLPISVAVAGEYVQAGHVYFAPDATHIIVGSNGRISFNTSPPIHSVRPAASYLFKSVARSYGNRVIGVLLTGMGCDGAQELLELHKLGAVTLLQDKASCVVYGMPGVAAKLGAGDYHLPPEQIARQLVRLSRSR